MNLIQRLRDPAPCSSAAFVTMDEAADEIERLRAENEKLREALIVAPLPEVFNPETQPPMLRAQLYASPIPTDKNYDDWFRGKRFEALGNVATTDKEGE